MGLTSSIRVLYMADIFSKIQKLARSKELRLRAEHSGDPDQFRQAESRFRASLDALENAESASWQPYLQGYMPPSPGEIRDTFKPLSASQVAAMLGVVSPRTIRKWISGESQIPYSAWRLFLVMTGRVVEDTFYPEVEE